MAVQHPNKIFDYRALRLLVGLIALSLPFVVTWLAGDEVLGSISGSYYTDARDAFVGMMFIVGAFLWAYKGHKSKLKGVSQKTLSKIAGVAAIGVAIFPTTHGDMPSTITSKLHYGSAAILFLILAAFCFIFFQEGIKGLTGKKGRRSKVYRICGVIMIACMLAIALKQIPAIEQILGDFRLTFWAEAIALCAFGVAWIIAGKYLSPFTDPEDKLKLFDDD